MTPERLPVVIVGAGLAGWQVAQAMRAGGCPQSIVIVGDETHAPYDRPPLSKAILAGEAAPASSALWPQGGPDGVSLRLGTAVAVIDRDARQLRLADGSTLRYHVLVLATGGRARPLPLPGGHLARTLRSRDDSVALAEQLRSGRSLAVIGGGFIGLEVAATARRLGLDVTLLEAASHLCHRVLPPELGDMLSGLHREQGVRVRLSARTTAIEALADGRHGVHLDDGSELRSDLVVAGIGMTPNCELAQAAGLEVDDGILVDADGMTSDPVIFAAGDVARPRGTHRLESWGSARDQALRVAARLLGQPAPARELPWFWSDQFDLNFQVLGSLPPRPPCARRGDFAARRGSAFWLDSHGRLEAVAACNAPRDIAVARRMSTRGIVLDAAALAHAATPLDSFLKGAARA